MTQRKKEKHPVARFKSLVFPVLSPRGMRGFFNTIAKNGKILDVGCGNGSPFLVKVQRPDVYYVGLDIGDYNQTPVSLSAADRYIITSPKEFAEEIARLPDSFDAVISAHNLEHCDEPDETLQAMLMSLKKGGRLYLSFPCEESVSFPSRNPLNFFDDPTHKRPPEFDRTVNAIRSAGFNVDFAAKRYRPLTLFLLGLILEPFGYLLKRNMPAGSTWALYGFETVIWASRSLS
jgi:SAM-dependent methyltransferase